METRLTPPQNPGDAVFHPHDVHGEDEREDDGGDPCRVGGAAVGAERVVQGDVDVDADAADEEDCGEEL